MLTPEEQESARILGEIAAKDAALDALERLYAAVKSGSTSDKLKAMEDAYAVLYFAGRGDHE